jgi:hypothetical protein
MWKHLAPAALAAALTLGASPPAPAATADKPDRPIYLGLTTWFASSPTWNAHFIVSMATPLGNTPWQLLTDYVPTLGSGHLNVGYRYDVGPVTLTPALGYRYFGAGSGTLTVDTRTFEVGPELCLGAAMPLASWLYLWAGVGYAPFMASPSGGGPGSYLDFNAALQANWERVSLSLGYGGLLFNGGQAGNPTGNLAMGGPIISVLTHF